MTLETVNIRSMEEVSGKFVNTFMPKKDPAMKQLKGNSKHWNVIVEEQADIIKKKQATIQDIEDDIIDNVAQFHQITWVM